MLRIHLLILVIVLKLQHVHSLWHGNNSEVSMFAKIGYHRKPNVVFLNQALTGSCIICGDNASEVTWVKVTADGKRSIINRKQNIPVSRPNSNAKCKKHSKLSTISVKVDQQLHNNRLICMVGTGTENNVLNMTSEPLQVVVGPGVPSLNLTTKQPEKGFHHGQNVTATCLSCVEDSKYGDIFWGVDSQIKDCPLVSEQLAVITDVSQNNKHDIPKEKLHEQEPGTQFKPTKYCSKIRKSSIIFVAKTWINCTNLVCYSFNFTDENYDPGLRKHFFDATEDLKIAGPERSTDNKNQFVDLMTYGVGAVVVFFLAIVMMYLNGDKRHSSQGQMSSIYDEIRDHDSIWEQTPDISKMMSSQSNQDQDVIQLSNGDRLKGGRQNDTPSMAVHIGSSFTVAGARSVDDDNISRTLPNHWVTEMQGSTV